MGWGGGGRVGGLRANGPSSGPPQVMAGCIRNLPGTTWWGRFLSQAKSEPSSLHCPFTSPTPRSQDFDDDCALLAGLRTVLTGKPAPLATPPKTFLCNVCGRSDGVELKECSQCRVAQYCSVDCQVRL